jgi:aminopeptidase N
MRIKMYLSLMLIGSIIFSCTTTTKREIITEKSAPNLTMHEAQIRKNKVSNVSYDLYFDISDKKEKYSGVSTINFELTHANDELRIDFAKGSITSTYVNGVAVEAKYNNHYLLIAGTHLRHGTNQIKIEFTQDFSRDGSGFYRFVDPEDKRIYTYTDLEPFDANKVFPCFDQPNLKATYKMKVKAPKDWVISTATLPTKIETAGEHAKMWNFSKSAKFSTYVWSLHAGPYHIFTDEKAKYPTRLFVRQSLKSYVKTKDWFTFTAQGFEFLNEYFGYEYPYHKYDQLLVPDFNAGAMENVAAVTFSERYISRGVKSQKNRRKMANVIFHEMAHMWFGNLVTMNWWNDLWLNESFATYLANLGLSRNTEFSNSAMRDFSSTKNWAYWEDQLVTTHPIEAVVPDTSQAFANFDGITYGKGASSLKQIHYFLGEEGFKKGLQIYFKRHANTNTQLKDFIKALQDGSKRDLSVWQKKWLQTAGVNTIGADYKCADGKITKFTMTQTAPIDYNHIRPHAFQIALLNKKSGKYTVEKVIKVEMTEATKEVATAIGANCPAIVYPNYEDHDYARVKLDENSLKTLKTEIGQISDNFLRQQLWSTVWDMVYYAQFSYKEYSQMVLDQALRIEKDDIVFRNILKTIHGRYSNAPSVMFYASFDKTMPKLKYIEFYKKFEKQIWKRLKFAKPGSEMQKVIFSSYVQTVTTPAGLKKLEDLLLGRQKLRDFKIDQDKRWHIISTLNSHSYKSAKGLLAKEQKKDPSSIGKKMVIKSNAMNPLMSSKSIWIEEFKKTKSEYSFSELKSAIYNLFPRGQNKSRQGYSEQFFTDMKWINDNKDGHVAETFTSLAPVECNNGSGNQITKFLELTKGLKPNVLKELKIRRQENQRCRAILDLAKNQY